MAVNLADNIKTAFINLNIRNVFRWTDNSACCATLVRENGNYNQFLYNRVDKIKEKNYMT